MNQHIEQADRYMEMLIGDGNVTIPAHTLASMAIAECLISIAKSLYALQLENEETKQPKENEDE